MNTSRLRMALHAFKNQFKRIPFKRKVFKASVASLLGGLLVGTCVSSFRSPMLRLEEDKTEANIKAPSKVETTPLIDPDPIVTPIIPLTFEKIMNDGKSKFIYFSDFGLTGNLKKFIEMVVKDMQETFELDAYYIDLRILTEEMKEYFKKQKIQLDVEEELSKYNFMLMNKYGDYWFWNFDLLGAYMSKEITLDLLRYFRSVKAISNMVRIPSDLIGQNTRK